MANATVSLESMLSTYPGSVDWVLVQYPDPHFKKKHHKRRVVQPGLVEALARLLRPGAKVLLQVCEAAHVLLFCVVGWVVGCWACGASGEPGCLTAQGQPLSCAVRPRAV